MKLSEILILAGPITYVICWIVVLIIILCTDVTDEVKYGLLIYAVMPIGALFKTGCGYLLAQFGW